MQVLRSKVFMLYYVHQDRCNTKAFAPTCVNGKLDLHSCSTSSNTAREDSHLELILQEHTINEWMNEWMARNSMVSLNDVLCYQILCLLIHMRILQCGCLEKGSEALAQEGCCWWSPDEVKQVSNSCHCQVTQSDSHPLAGTERFFWHSSDDKLSPYLCLLVFCWLLLIPLSLSELHSSGQICYTSERNISCLWRTSSTVVHAQAFSKLSNAIEEWLLASRSSRVHYVKNVVELTKTSTVLLLNSVWCNIIGS